jgi:hypothetical protein
MVNGRQSMIACYRAVSNATTDDDQQPPGSALAEALQLAREPSNIKRLVDNSVKRLTSHSVVVRVKALRFLNHLAQNGPAAVIAELRLNTTAISDCMAFRGPPHPTRGYEPYQEMKDTAQTLLDLSFSAAQSTPISSFQSTSTGGLAAPLPGRVGGFSTMQSYGNDGATTQSASLEPRSLDPNRKDYVGDVVGFFKRKFGQGPEPPTESKYGSSSNVPGSSQEATDLSNPQFLPTAMATVPPPPRGLMDRLQTEVSWSGKKPSEPVTQKPKPPTDTPAAKLLRITGNRALPTNGELNAFRGALTPGAIAELEAGLADTDWKVRVRAIGGLECYGEKFGWGPVANSKDAIAKLVGAPQASLRAAATRLFQVVKDTEPTPPPEEPSAFDLGGSGEDSGGEGGFHFSTD